MNLQQANIHSRFVLANLGGPSEPSQSFTNARRGLKINVDVGSGPVVVQTNTLKSLTCLDSTQANSSPLVAFVDGCQITGKAGPQTN